MKNKEEDILKRFLQDTFSDYEPEPSDITWENIRKEIQPQQPNIGAGFKQWIVPVVALLLLIGGIVLNVGNSKNELELAMNSTKENTKNNSQINDYQKTNNDKSTKQNIANTNGISEKIYVNTTTSKVESKVIPIVEKSLELPTFSTILNEQADKKNVQEYSVSTKEFVGVVDNIQTKFVGISANIVLKNSADKSEDVLKEDNAIEIQNAGSVRPNSEIVVRNEATKKEDVKEEINNAGRVQNPASVRPTSVERNIEIVIKNNALTVVSIPTDYTVNTSNENTINFVEKDAGIQQIRYIKPLETLKNKDFILVKNELRLPEISEININRDPKPIRRPVFVNVSITPLQTYRILTVNSQNVQNLQTNKLFDSERNGWAFELGITKSIGNKWNFRGGVSYLKMRQWAEYQVNTNNISVKNANNYSNNSANIVNENEFIGQTRMEAKTLQMVGLKADVQRFFKVTGRNRYFISGGSQLMYESTQKQSNVFINASAGFQHLVNKDCFLTIEPTASYLLNNINDSKSLIQTNAYNLGLKVGVNFRVK